LRNPFATAALAIVLAVHPVHAQTSPLVGSWRGYVDLNGLSVTLDLVLQADGHYSEQEVSAYGGTMQIGSWFAGNGMLQLRVEDYEPKQHMVYHGTGTTGGYTTMEPSAPPPGGTYSVQMLSQDSFVLQDQGGSVRFDRVY
jgi:hypothetical protein